VISIGIVERGVFVGCGKAEQYPHGRSAVNIVRAAGKGRGTEPKVPDILGA